MFICSQWITCSTTDDVTDRNVMTERVQDLNTPEELETLGTHFEFEE